MSQYPDDTRNEIKFVVPVTETYRIESWVACHRLAFRTAFPPRRVNNVYFDNADLATFAENLSGVSARVKIRFRWYGTDRDRVTGKLELKYKRNKLGWKRNYRVKDLQLAGTPWREVVRRIREQLPQEARLWIEGHPEPVVVNRYRRRYLVSANGLIRITLDTDLAIIDQRMRRVPGFDARANIPDVMIVEAKADGRHHVMLGDAVQDIPVRASRFSKYASGVANVLYA